MRLILVKQAACIIAIFIAGSSTALAGDTELIKGGKIFESHCAICHGIGGKGDGPLAKELVTPPADLTQIAQRNGGSFPEGRVRKTIEYGGGITSHGPSNMLAWGAFFMIDGSPDDAKARINFLTEYINSLQRQ